MSLIGLCILILGPQLTTFRTQVLGESPSKESTLRVCCLTPASVCTLCLVHMWLKILSLSFLLQPQAAMLLHHCGYPSHRTVRPNKLSCKSLLVLVFYNSNRGIANTIRRTLHVNCFSCIKVIQKWK